MEQSARDTLARLSVRTLKSVRQQVSSLSGGQRQTVAIAKAVLWESKLVILDEPTAALGVAQTRQVLDLVRRLADTGHAVVFISHNMIDVFEVADRVAALYLGRVAADVPIAEVDRPRSSSSSPPAARAISASPPRPPPRRSLRRRCPAQCRRPPRMCRRARVPQAGFEGDVVDDSVRGYARAYVNRVRGGDLGALPAVAGIVVLAILFTASAAGHLPDAAEHHQPARPGGAHQPAGDGPGLRPAAGRDRPVRRCGERRLRRRDGGDDGPVRLRLVLGRPRGHGDRHC